ncbi:MAG: MarR family transcriptional regulator [Clostridia bacterium]|nr:MarR family transcriptional regulator [Clostridia bacterium]
MEKKRRVGAKLRRLDLLMRFHLRSRDESLIPPAQMRMLEFIERNDGCTQAEVAEDMQVSPASVAQSLKRMEAAEFIRRDACKGNLRANSLHITERGVEAAKNCRLVFDGLESCMLAGLSAEEREQFSSLLDRLIANLESGDTGAMNNMELSKLLDASEKQPKGETK